MMRMLLTPYQTAAIAMSVAAFLVSLLTAYFSFFHRGRVVFPPPVKIGLVYHYMSRTRMAKKVFLRAFFSATSKQGRYIENLNVELEKEGENPFRIQSTMWGVHNDGKKHPSAPFFIGEDGTVGDYHFFFDTPHNQYDEGVYKIRLKAKIHQNSEVQILWEDRFEINEAEKSVVFHRKIDTGNYINEIEAQHQGTPPASIPEPMHPPSEAQHQGTPPASIPEPMHPPSENKGDIMEDVEMPTETSALLAGKSENR